MGLTKNQEHRITELSNSLVNRITYAIAKEKNDLQVINEIVNEMFIDFLQFVSSFQGEMHSEDLLKLENIVNNGVLEIGGKIDYFNPTQDNVSDIISLISETVIESIDISNE
jgi:hypothetical protein